MTARTVRLPGRLTVAALGAGVLAWLAGAAGAQVELDRPLSVEECVTVALEHNHQLGQVEANVVSSRGSARAALRAVLPYLSTSTSWTRQWFSQKGVYVIGGEVFTDVDVLYDARVAVSGSQSILDLEGLDGLRSSRARLSAAEFDLDAARADVELQARQQFYTALAAIKLAEVEENAVAVAREQLRRAETLFNLGSVARSDVLQARVNLAEGEMNAIERRNAVRVERSRLALVMGLDPRRDISIDTTLVVPAEDPGGEIDEWVQAALGARPEYAAAQARLRAAEISESGARLGRLPTVGVNASWATSGRGTDMFLEASNNSSGWNISLGAQLTLFDGLQRGGQIESAVGARRSSEEAYRQEEQDIILEVKDTFLAIAKERESLRAAQTSVALAQENLRLQQALYESGAGTLLEWDNARLDQRRAQVSLIQAEISLVLAHLGFNRAVAR